MSDVTAVPLRPIKKGSLTRLWLGVGAACVAAGALAYAGTSKVSATACSVRDFKGAKPVATASGLIVQTVKPGTGASPTDTDVTLVDYKGTLRGGKVFDQNQRTPFPVTGVIPGFTEALKMMQVGGSYKICIPPALGYGPAASGPIPANSVLFFDVNLLDFRSQAEIQAMQQQMQQLQAQGKLPPGVQPGPPPPRGAVPGQ
jgi:FKBP-type peptidyl-prolyl cis-trans isomerase FkpA